MEFIVYKFKHRSVDFSNQSISTHLGSIRIHQVENFVSSDFLQCYNPDRFVIRHVFFSFLPDDDVFSYYELIYKDALVTFHLYFSSFILLEKFFRYYEDDYNLFKSLNIVFKGQNPFCTFIDCLDELYPHSFGESSNVCECVADSEQRGLLSDELPF